MARNQKGADTRHEAVDGITKPIKWFGFSELLRLSTSPSGASQADFFRGKLNGITFPYSSGGIHFVAFFLKLLGTKNSMIFAINNPTCKNKTEAKKFSF